MSRERLSVPDPRCVLRTSKVRNSATTGVASATATATAAQQEFDNHLLADEIRAVRAQVGGATDSATESTTKRAVLGGSSCALNEAHSQTVVVGPWRPLAPDQVADERCRVLEEEPRRWWWQPRYRLAELERGGLSRTEAMAKVRAESESDP